MLNTPLLDIAVPQIQELIAELEQVTGLSVAGHGNFRLLDYLQRMRTNAITDKRQRIDAARHYPGSLLRTKIGKLAGTAIDDLVTELCDNFKANHAEVPHIENKTHYVFLNDILNPKSKLRKPPPIRF